MKRRHLKRPPGHPLINVSECCMGSPGSQQQNWVYQLFAKLLFSCCGSLTGDSPQMNNTSPRFNSESIRNEALFAQCFLTCAAECEAVNGLWRAGVTAKSYKIFIVWGVCKLTDLLLQINSEWLQPEDQRSDRVTWWLRARLQERAGKRSGIWLNNNLLHINILTWSQNSRSRFSDLNTDSVKYGWSF